MERPELAAFLRTRRSRIRPGDVGLPVGGRRRTPGLRREEVARLAGISVDYYARLEQARGPRPSRQVLTALGRALRLSDDERAHLHHLAGEAPAPPDGPSPDVPAGILHLLDRLDDTPAYVIDAKYDVLAWNPMCAALMGDPDTWLGAEHNMMWHLFCGPYRITGETTDRQVLEFAGQCVADLRAAAARYPRDPGIRALIAKLSAGSTEFLWRWAEHRVCAQRGTTAKHYEHPVVGPLDLDCDVLEIPDRGQRVVIYTAVPGSASHDALRLLAVVGTQWSQADSG